MLLKGIVLTMQCRMQFLWKCKLKLFLTKCLSSCQQSVILAFLYLLHKSRNPVNVCYLLSFVFSSSLYSYYEYNTLSLSRHLSEEVSKYGLTNKCIVIHFLSLIPSNEYFTSLINLSLLIVILQSLGCEQFRHDLAKC